MALPHLSTAPSRYPQEYPRSSTPYGDKRQPQIWRQETAPDMATRDSPRYGDKRQPQIWRQETAPAPAITGAGAVSCGGRSSIWLVEHGTDGADVTAQLRGLGFQFFVDFVASVHHCAVVAVAQQGADAGQRGVGLFAHQVHRDL